MLNIDYILVESFLVIPKFIAVLCVLGRVGSLSLSGGSNFNCGRYQLECFLLPTNVCAGSRC